MASNPWAFPAALVFVFVLSPLIAAQVRAYRITIGFGLDGIGCGLLIMTAQTPLTAAARRWASLLAWPPLVMMGTLSYGLHLLQQPFLTNLNTTFSGRFPLSLLAALVCAAASFLWIERPALRAKEFFSRSAL
jgi:peptidoglycan/LPS O-acetylase OafA/YrhL